MEEHQGAECAISWLCLWLCEPKMVPTCVTNPLKPLRVGFRCIMIILKNIKRVMLGVKLCLGLRLVLCS